MGHQNLGFLSLPLQLPVLKSGLAHEFIAWFSLICILVMALDRTEAFNVFVLLVLYIIQGLPLGLAGAFPLLLKERGVATSDLATLSLGTLPFSLKLLWAPIVDSCYVHQWGRRKSWIIPLQILLGLGFLGMSGFIEGWVPETAEDVQINKLTLAFGLLAFFAATQDIAVDAWALTLLKEENVGLASTTNAIGQILGHTIAFGGFMVMDTVGLTTSMLLNLMGAAVLLTTCLVAFFVKEVHVAEETLDTKESFACLLEIMKLKSVARLGFFFLVLRSLAFMPVPLHALKFQELGISKERMAVLSSFALPVGLIVPVVTSKMTTGAYPLLTVMGTLVPTLLVTLVLATLVYFGELLFTTHVWLEYTSYALLIGATAVMAVTGNMAFVGTMAFFNRISDPNMGGTYMTFFNAMSNLISKFTEYLGLLSDDYLRISGTPDTAGQRWVLDGYYVLIAGTFIGAVLLNRWLNSTAKLLSEIPLEEWRIQETPKTSKGVE